MTYRGRFAPSPTGPLHFGSLVAAAASYLDARSRGGAWLVRMEDVDLPRVQPGAAELILRTLERFGFEWDGGVMYQSERTGAYREALDRLRAAGQAFPCGCTRKEVSEAGQRYPGTCRAGLPRGRTARAWRVWAGEETMYFEDRLQGRQWQNLAEEVGDFVVLRADGLFAYQLAVVVDDAAQGITDVVRGADLLDSTPRQIRLLRLLGFEIPRYLHVPVALNREGQKLSKQTLALAVDPAAAGSQLAAAMTFLGQDPPAGLERAGAKEILRWATEAWDARKIPAVQAMPAPEGLT
ncbi:MAG: tRNA glutamyl-Q(34) synthetase GluQRS [Bryobacteraceae bacterium]